MAAPEPSSNQPGKVKFSILLYPEGPVQETIDIIRVCDELDFLRLLQCRRDLL